MGKTDLFITDMVLSESFKNKLQRLAGIAESTLVLEGDKRSVIINRLKLPSDVASWAHNLSDKYSIWIADSFKRDFLDYVNSENPTEDRLAIINKVLSAPSLKDYKPEGTYEQKVKEVILNRAQELTPTYQYILDWLKGRQTLAPEHDQINFKTLTFQEAQERSTKWHDELAKIQGGQIDGEDGEVVLTFPTGFYWIRLGRAKCDKEAKAMGHCGSGKGMLYSLRRDKYPFITADIDESSGRVMQMKGRANTKPKPELHKYIIPLILGDKPDIKYFHSTYQPETDFNISDLNTEQIQEVVSKKPSLMFLANGGIEGVKKMTDRFIQELLLTKPEAVGSFVEGCNNNKIVLSDVLKNPEMVDWALLNAKLLFSVKNYGSVSLNSEQLEQIIKDKEFAGSFNIDKINLDATTLNYIVYNNPGLFQVSKQAIFKLNTKQLDYLIKNAPIVFQGLMDTATFGNIKQTAIIVEYLGPQRLTVLFKKHPEFFALDDTGCFTNIFPSFLTGEMLFEYVRTHNPNQDPLRFYEIRRLEQFDRYSDGSTKLYLIQNYPDLFYKAGFATKSLSPAIGKYMFDNHFDWIKKNQGGNGYKTRGFTFNMYDWQLSPEQLGSLIEGEVNGSSGSLLSYYDAEDLAKFNFDKKQVNRLLDENSNLRINDLSIDIIKGLRVAPEFALPLMGEILVNNEDNRRTIFNEIATEYGEESAHNIYVQYTKELDSLELDTKYKNLKRLSKFNGPFQEYTEAGVKFRFDDWSDEDLIEMFDNDSQELVKQIVNWGLDIWHENKFSDINFNNFDKLNIARIKYLVTKAFPKEFKNTIKELNDSQLYNLIEDPNDVLEDWDSSEHEVDDNIINEIKTAIERAFDDAQRYADEVEYHNLLTNALENAFGKFEWVKHPKVPNYNKQTNKTTYRESNLIEFRLSWDEFQELVVEAEKHNQQSNDPEYYSINSNTTVIGAIKMGLQGREEELEVEEPYYGVQGDVKDEDLNDNINHHLFENDTLSPLLDKAKIVTKRVKKSK